MTNIGGSIARTVRQVVILGAHTSSISNSVGHYVWHCFDVIRQVIRLAKL
jgi:hypothetical protein